MSGPRQLLTILLRQSTWRRYAYLLIGAALTAPEVAAARRLLSAAVGAVEMHHGDQRRAPRCPCAREPAVERRADDLELKLTNPLDTSQPQSPGGGRGLHGIRGRVTSLRGQVTAGADAGHRHVNVRLPLHPDAMSIGVLLVDDEPITRSGLRAIISAEPDLAVLDEADDGAAVTPLVRRLRPDVVLMDVRMPIVDGIEATRRLLSNVDDPPRILVLTTFENDDYVFDALRAGASGFLLKRARADEVIRASRLLAAVDSLLFPAAIRELAARPPPAVRPSASTPQVSPIAKPKSCA